MSTPVTVTTERNAAGRYDYIVTTPMGYRAVLPRCDRDDCRDGKIIECRRKLNYRHQHEVNDSTSVNVWLKHSRTHCHGWHDERVKDFATDVQHTYGSARRMRSINTLKYRHAPNRLPVESVAELLGMTLEEYRVELARAAS